MLFNTNSAILQVYHGENKLILNEMMMVRFVLDQHTGFFKSATSLKQHSGDWDNFFTSEVYFQHNNN